ncbi:MAG: AgmX/PglI C-terminal domain-containing protein [Myxococcota bacterium]
MKPEHRTVVVLAALAAAAALSSVWCPRSPEPPHTEATSPPKLKSGAQPLRNTEQFPEGTPEAQENSAPSRPALPARLKPGARSVAAVMQEFARRDGGAESAPGGGDAPGPGTTTPQGGAAGATGGGARLDKDDIKAAVRAVIPSMKHCYESGQKMTPESQGKVSIAFTLVAADGGGFMRDAEIKSSDLGNPIIDACLLQSLTEARFPVPEGEGEVRVTYPFVFRGTAETSAEQTRK